MNVNALFNTIQFTNIIMYGNEIIHKLLIDVFFNFLPYEIKTKFYFQY